MAYSYNEWLYSGITIFNINFDYLSKSDVSLYINGTIRPSSELVWITDSQVQVSTTGLVLNDVIKIQRKTSIAAPIVNYTSGSRLNETNLDNSNLQNIFINQETRDNAVINVGSDPSVIENRTLAELAASNAQTAALEASGYADDAEASKNTAVTAQNSATSQATASEASAELARRYANEDYNVVIEDIGGEHQYSAKHWADVIESKAGTDIGDFVQLIDDGSGTAIIDPSLLIQSSQANWAQTDSSKPDYIKNRPLVDSIPALNSPNLVASGGVYSRLATKAAVAHDHTQSSITDLPTILTTGSSSQYLSADGTYSTPSSTSSNWGETDSGEPGFISNKPVIPTYQYDGSAFTLLADEDPDGTFLDNTGNYSVPAGDSNVQSDWSEADSGDDSFILNKPSVYDGTTTSTRVFKSLVALDSNNRLPVMDGSQLTGISASGGTGEITDTFENQVFVNTGDKAVVYPVGSPVTSGVLAIGEYYEILDYNSGDDFTNVGASTNRVGVIFKATGTTPDVWVFNSSLQEFQYVTLDGDLVVASVDVLSLDLGDTDSTAFRGDLGLIAYDHSQETGNAHNASLASLTSDTTHRTVTDAQISTWTAKQNVPSSGSFLAVNSTQSAVLASTTASFTTSLEAKLNSIESGADVTDTLGVKTAGAVMRTDTTLSAPVEGTWSWVEPSTATTANVGSLWNQTALNPGVGDYSASEDKIPTSKAVANFVLKRIADNEANLTNVLYTSTKGNQLKALPTNSIISQDDVLLMERSNVFDGEPKKVTVQQLGSAITVGSATTATTADKFKVAPTVNVVGALSLTGGAITSWDGSTALTLNTQFIKSTLVDALTSIWNPLSIVTIAEDSGGNSVTVTAPASGTATTLSSLGVTATATEINTVAAGTSAKNSHTHDDRYYTESEITVFLTGKSDSTHIHDNRYYTESEVDAKIAAIPNTGTSLWQTVSNYIKPVSFDSFRILNTGEVRMFDSLDGIIPANGVYSESTMQGSYLNILSYNKTANNPLVQIHKRIPPGAGTATVTSDHTQVMTMNLDNKSANSNIFGECLTAIVRQDNSYTVPAGSSIQSGIVGVQGRAMMIQGGGHAYAGWFVASRWPGYSTSYSHGIEIDMYNYHADPPFVDDISVFTGSPQYDVGLTIANNPDGFDLGSGAHVCTAGIWISGGPASKGFYNGIMFNNYGCHPTLGVGINMSKMTTKYGMKLGGLYTGGAHIWAPLTPIIMRSGSTDFTFESDGVLTLGGAVGQIKGADTSTYKGSAALRVSGGTNTATGAAGAMSSSTRVAGTTAINFAWVAFSDANYLCIYVGSTEVARIKQSKIIY